MGGELHILHNQRCEVERAAILVVPAGETEPITGGVFRLLGGFSVLHRLRRRGGCFGRGIITQIERHLVCRHRPFGIQGDISGGHGFAGKDILFAFAKLVVMPPVENVPILSGRGISRSIIRILNRLLVLFVYRFVRNAAVNEGDYILVAGIVEFGVVVSTSNLSSFFVRVSLQRILILLRYAVASS